MSDMYEALYGNKQKDFSKCRCEKVYINAQWVGSVAGDYVAPLRGNVYLDYRLSGVRACRLEYAFINMGGAVGGELYNLSQLSSIFFVNSSVLSKMSRRAQFKLASSTQHTSAQVDTSQAVSQTDLIGYAFDTATNTGQPGQVISGETYDANPKIIFEKEEQIDYFDWYLTFPPNPSITPLGINDMIGVEIIISFFMND